MRELRAQIATAMAARRSDAEGQGAIMDAYGDLADAAIAAIEASGTHVVVPAQPTEEMVAAGQDVLDGDGIFLDGVAGIISAALAARPRHV